MLNESDPIFQELQQRLGQGIQIDALPDTVINRCYRVRQGATRYFLKCFNTATAPRLDRQALFEQQTLLARQGMACMPVYLSAQHDFQLDTWVDSATLANSALSRQQKCQRLASTLATIHQLQVPLQKLDLAADWQHYLTLTGQPAELAYEGELGAMLSFWQQESQQDCVVCHNDLALSHVTEAPCSIIFDWEYSALASPFFDLASCITINQLNAAEQSILVDEYANSRSIAANIVKQKVALMLPLVAKTYELWSLAYGASAPKNALVG